MRRRSRSLVTLLGIGVASTLLLSACGETTVPEATVATATDSHVSQALDLADLPTTTTTTAPPPTTTTAPPTTTTTTAPPPPSPPTTAAAPAPPATTNVVAAPAPEPAPTAACTEAGLLGSINGERAKNGLQALTLRGGATAVACSWSNHMTVAGLGHNGHLSADLAAQGVTGWKTIGENVGYAGSASQVFGLFMGSSGHRDNILKSSYTQVGIGVVKAGSLVWVTLDFVGF